MPWNYLESPSTYFSCRYYLIRVAGKTKMNTFTIECSAYMCIVNANCFRQGVCLPSLTGYQSWIFNIAFKSQNLSTIFKAHKASPEASLLLTDPPLALATWPTVSSFQIPPPSSPFISVVSRLIKTMLLLDSSSSLSPKRVSREPTKHQVLSRADLHSSCQPWEQVSFPFHRQGNWSLVKCSEWSVIYLIKGNESSEVLLSFGSKAPHHAALLLRVKVHFMHVEPRPCRASKYRFVREAGR